jgi:valyl-tRNA synthetase
VRVSAGAAGDTIMRTEFPNGFAVPTDAQAEPEMRWVMDFILGVRQIRGEMDIAPSRKLEILLQNAGSRDLDYLGRNLHYLVRLAGIEPPRVLAAAETAPISAVALLGNLEILVPMKGLIDPSAELERLAKRLRKAESDLSKLDAKLSNSQFAKNAPADIVAKDQQRLEELRTEIGQLSAQTARVTKLKNQ